MFQEDIQTCFRGAEVNDRTILNLDTKFLLPSLPITLISSGRPTHSIQDVELYMCKCAGLCIVYSDSSAVRLVWCWSIAAPSLTPFDPWPVTLCPPWPALAAVTRDPPTQYILTPDTNHRWSRPGSPQPSTHWQLWHRYTSLRYSQSLKCLVPTSKNLSRQFLNSGFNMSSPPEIVLLRIFTNQFWQFRRQAS